VKAVGEVNCGERWKVEMAHFSRGLKMRWS
jgi:hypothetical protein